MGGGGKGSMANALGGVAPKVKAPKMGSQRFINPGFPFFGRKADHQGISLCVPPVGPRLWTALFADWEVL